MVLARRSALQRRTFGRHRSTRRPELLRTEIESRERVSIVSHIWDESCVDSVDPGQTVNVVYHARPVDDPSEIRLNDQYDDYRVVKEIEPWMHRYVRQYIKDMTFVD